MPVGIEPHRHGEDRRPGFPQAPGLVQGGRLGAGVGRARQARQCGEGDHRHAVPARAEEPVGRVAVHERAQAPIAAIDQHLPAGAVRHVQPSVRIQPDVERFEGPGLFRGGPGGRQLAAELRRGLARALRIAGVGRVEGGSRGHHGEHGRGRQGAERRQGDG